MDNVTLLDGIRLLLQHTIGHLTPEEQGQLLQIVTSLVKAGAEGTVAGMKRDG